MRVPYVSLQLRKEIKVELDEAKKQMEKDMGMFLTYSQFIVILCRRYKQEGDNAGDADRG